MAGASILRGDRRERRTPVADGRVAVWRRIKGCAQRAMLFFKYVLLFLCLKVRIAARRGLFFFCELDFAPHLTNGFLWCIM